MSSGIEKAVHYIKTHWKQGKTLKEIAQIHGVDAGNLAREFKRGEGLTVKQFVNNNRKAWILQHMIDKQLFGYELGQKIGFHNDLSFYRWVKLTFGVPFTELLKGGDKKE